MPCFLSTTARTAFRGINILHRTRKNVIRSPSLVRQYAATAHALQSQPPEPPNTNHAPSKAALTPAQTARAACKAVHLALKNPDTGLQRAFLIVNSLHFSNIQNHPARDEHPLYQKFKEVAIKFDRPIPPGLASTALLHGLVRLGKTKDAGRLAVQMMATGIHLKTKTLELVHKNLIPTGVRWNTFQSPFPTVPNFVPNPSSLPDIASMAQNESTRLALDLFALAENHQHQTKRGMFATLITICLINGEIILASLLLGYFVKDAHSRSNAAQNASAKLTEDVPPPEGLEELHEPGPEFMARNVDARRILFTIDRTFQQNGDSEEFAQSLQVSLQALANLASLLENETVIIPELALLLRTLYHAPRVGNTVWINGEYGRPTQVEAYEYFHCVLQRVIERLPTARASNDLSNTNIPAPSALSASASTDESSPEVLVQSNKATSPDLNLNSYNTLLHYSLRHHFSLSFAERILLHMMHGRQSGPLAPEQEFFNIILRSGSLLNKPGVARQAIESYRTFYPQSHRLKPLLKRRRKRDYRALTKARSEPRNDNADTTAEAVELMLSLARARLYGHRLCFTPKDFTPENHAISNLILHVTSTGTPEVVTNLIRTMFPELFIPILRRHPGKYRSVFTSGAELDTKGRIRARRRAAIRGMSYGPYVFSALLNALRKAGKTRLAWAVWCLARRSEKRSWKSREPWCLHVSAYDSMLRCLSMDLQQESHAGGFILRRRRRRGANGLPLADVREGKALQAAWRLYQNMKYKGRRLRRVFYKDRGLSSKLWDKLKLGEQIPKPDAKLFNSALDLFILPTLRAKWKADANSGNASKDSTSLPSETESATSEKRGRQERTPDEIWQEFDRLRRINIETGYVSEDWNKLFQMLAEDMVKAGHPIPPGLRYIFIGRWEPGMLNSPQPAVLERTPYVQPRTSEKRFSPFYLSAPPEKSMSLRTKRIERISRLRPRLKQSRSSRDI